MGVEKMEARAKLREARATLREIKERVEVLLREREYAKAVEEIEAFSQGYTPGERDLEWAELQVRLAFAQEQLGRYDTETAEVAYEVLKLTDRRREVGTIEWILGKMQLGLGKTKTALRYLRNSLAEFDRLEDERRKAQVLNTLGQGYFLNGRTKQAIEHLTEALDLCHQNKGDKGQEAMVKGNLGTVHRRAAIDWPLASKMLRSSLKLYEKLGNDLEISRRATALCRLYILQRKWDKASEITELLDRAQKLADEGGYQRERATVWESRGWWEIALAQREGGTHLEAAEQALLQALQIGQRIAPEGDIVMEASERLGWVCLMRGSLDGALSYGERSLRLAQHLGSVYDKGLAHRLLGAVYQARGEERETKGERGETKEERRKAREHFVKSVSLLEKAEARYDLALSLFYSGRFLIEDGESRTEGERQLLEAVRAFKGLKVSHWLARSIAERARGLILDHHLDEAREALVRARVLLEEAGEREALKEVDQVRAEWERASDRATVEAREEQGLLERLEQVSAEELGKLLWEVAQRASAQRGLIGYKGSEEMILRRHWGMEEEEARRLLKGLNSLDGEVLKPRQPVFSTLASEDKRFPFLRDKEVSSLMFVPLGLNSQVEGIVYMDRVSGEPFRQRELNFFVRSAGILQVKVVEFQRDELLKENLSLRERLEEKHGFGNIVTLNPKMEEALRTAQSFRDSRLPILIQGETGTGKELMAEAIHYSSQRRDKRFLPVNCAAFTDTLLESELFGHKKGSFTNAIQDEKGLFEEAQGGTLFLDEVANASGELQAKLLRVLEEMEIRKVGETKSQKVEVSIISATNKNLEREVKAGRFRKDLYYRLAGVEIKLPPLRERKEDIQPLIYHFLELFTEKKGGKIKGITKEALGFLTAYDWPGNVRELKNEVERVAILAEGGWITPAVLSEGIRTRESELSGEIFSLELKGSLGEILKKVRREMMENAVKRTGGNKTKAARLLGITREALSRRLKEFQTEGKL